MTKYIIKNPVDSLQISTFVYAIRCTLAKCCYAITNIKSPEF